MLTVRPTCLSDLTSEENRILLGLGKNQPNNTNTDILGICLVLTFNAQLYWLFFRDDNNADNWSSNVSGKYSQAAILVQQKANRGSDRTYCCLEITKSACHDSVHEANSLLTPGSSTRKCQETKDRKIKHLGVYPPGHFGSHSNGWAVKSFVSGAQI